MQYIQKEANDYLKNQILRLLPKIVINLTNEHEKGVVSSSSLLFDLNKPSISFSDYIKRIVDDGEIDSSTLIHALILMDRVLSSHLIALKGNNIYKLFFISILLSVKFLEDIIYDDLFYSLLSGIPLNDMINLEHEFLVMLNYRLYVEVKLFNQYLIEFM